ncbi:thioredoxin domain-containing protein [Candidatus Uhrbacteria bacterium]|nr:thioredoxin domain-containing protein [Candidatus Uhrbacteria bacterium]
MDQLSPNKPSSLFDVLNAKSAFWLGFVTAILVLCTVGFIILGTQILKGGTINLGLKAPSAAGAVADAGVTDPTTIPTPEPTAVPVVTDADHIRGAKDAAITVIEYSDFQCPFCQNFHPTMQQVMKNYDGKVRWIYRHFPLSFHPNALPAANAAECASEQGKFWEFADDLFANQDSESDAYYKQLAGKLGLNVNQWEDCYRKSKYDGKIQQQSQDGANAGVNGTPGSFIIDKDGNAIPIKGALPYSSVSAAIDQLLKT